MGILKNEGGPVGGIFFSFKNYVVPMEEQTFEGKFVSASPGKNSDTEKPEYSMYSVNSTAGTFRKR